jgi:hypothetical protein
MNDRYKWKNLFVLICACMVVGTSAAIAEEQPAILPEDPLLLVGTDRLELLIRDLRTRTNIELLLGTGVASGREGGVRYLVVEREFNLDTRFASDVEVIYDDRGELTNVSVPFRTKKMIVSPKVVGAVLASQVPKSVEGTKEFLEKAMKSLDEKAFQPKPEMNK